MCVCVCVRVRVRVRVRVCVRVRVRVRVCVYDVMLSFLFCRAPPQLLCHFSWMPRGR